MDDTSILFVDPEIRLELTTSSLPRKRDYQLCYSGILESFQHTRCSGIPPSRGLRYFPRLTTLALLSHLSLHGHPHYLRALHQLCGTVQQWENSGSRTHCLKSHNLPLWPDELYPPCKNNVMPRQGTIQYHCSRPPLKDYFRLHSDAFSCFATLTVDEFPEVQLTFYYIICTPAAIRTQDPQLRRLLLLSN